MWIRDTLLLISEIHLINLESQNELRNETRTLSRSWLKSSLSQRGCGDRMEAV